MRITARGWRRNAGTSVILEDDLRNAKTRMRLNPMPGTHLYRSDTGVRIEAGPETLTLGGQYKIDIELTRDDVMRLFMRCFPEVADVAKAMYTPPPRDAVAAA
jgi:hypothetical protein